MKKIYVKETTKKMHDDDVLIVVKTYHSKVRDYDYVIFR